MVKTVPLARELTCLSFMYIATNGLRYLYMLIYYWLTVVCISIYIAINQQAVVNLYSLAFAGDKSLLLELELIHCHICDNNINVNPW